MESADGSFDPSARDQSTTCSQRMILKFLGADGGPVGNTFVGSQLYAPMSDPPSPFPQSGDVGTGFSPSSSVKGIPSGPSGFARFARRGSPPLIPCGSQKF